MKRSKQHKIDNRAQAILKNNAPDYWSMQDPSEDYGTDYYVQVFDKETGEAKPIFFLIQLKGTEKFNENEEFVKFIFKTETLNHYLKKVHNPIFLIFIETTSKRIFYLFLQEYINETLNNEKPNWINQKTVTINIPKSNVFNSDKIEKIAKYGMEYSSLLVNGMPTFELETKIRGISNNSIEKSKLMDEKYNEFFIEETKVGIELLYKENEILESKKRFLSIYNKTKNNKENVEIHLKSLIAIISLAPESDIKNETKILEEIEYGLELSKDNELYYLNHYFLGLKFEKYFYKLNENIVNLNIMIKNLENSNNNLDKIIFINLLEDLNKNYILLVKVYDDFYNNKLESLDNEEWFVFSDLFYKFIKMNLYNISLNLPKFKFKELKPLYDNTFDLIKIFENLTKLFSNLHLKFQLYEIKSLFYYYKKDNKCIEIASEYMNLAKNNESKNQYEIAKALKEHYENNPVSLVLSNKTRKEISEEEIDNYYKELFLSDNIDIDDENDEIAHILKIGLKDRNPERVLKKCENLEIKYLGGGIPAKVYGLYSAGMKNLYCKHGGDIGGMDLDDIYEFFKNEWCAKCEHKKPRDDKWKWSIKWQIDNDKSN